MSDVVYRRKTIRLKDWDYSSEGAYYVTLCTDKMGHLFGKVANENMELNGFGKIVQKEWLRTAELRTNVVIDEFIVMPNHLHGIIMILEKAGGKAGRGELTFAHNKHLRSPSQSLGSIIRGFKSASTRRINENRNSMNEKIWQRNYYERIIRNYNELDKFRNYILENPV